MKTPSIHIQDNGPLQVKGAFELVDAEGNKYEIKQDVSLCRCGASDNKPFCDRSHEEIHFKSAPRAERQTIEV